MLITFGVCWNDMWCLCVFLLCHIACFLPLIIAVCMLEYDIEPKARVAPVTLPPVRWDPQKQLFLSSFYICLPFWIFTLVSSCGVYSFVRESVCWVERKRQCVHRCVRALGSVLMCVCVCARARVCVCDDLWECFHVQQKSVSPTSLTYIIDSTSALFFPPIIHSLSLNFVGRCRCCR